MRNIRKLCFQASDGQRLGLNGQNGVYATNLSGFGLSLAPAFSSLSGGFFRRIDEEDEPQATIGLTIVFTKSAYADYNTFLSWLARAGRVSLVYDPTGTQEYCRDIVVGTMSKGEKNAVGWLEIPCTFLCTTPWYKPQPTALALWTGSTGQKKVYPYRYTNDLRYGLEGGAALSGVVAGTGHIPGALELTCYGQLQNPRIKLVGNATGKTYGICAIDAAFSDTDTLKFSTRRNDAFVHKISADGTVTDLLDALDLSTNPFFRVPVDEPCTLTVEAETMELARAELLIYYYYRSV